MKFSESTLKYYALPLSETEDIKCKRAIEAVRDALKDLGYTDDNKSISLLESNTLSYAITMRNPISSARIHAFIQGSYANNTCVRNESDVDIAIVREDIYEYAFGEKFDIFVNEKESEARALKDAVERALKNRFPNQVKRGNKSIKVEGNTYRKQADTVPCLAMHYYYRSDQQDYTHYHDGIIIVADDGSIIRNFPKQHIANGKSKNIRTNFYYKKVVRIMKKMRHLMSDYGYHSADAVSSFGIESLLWNVPDSSYTNWSNYGFTFQRIIEYLYNNKAFLPIYKEANGIKKLCPTKQDVLNYEKFINDLRIFYNYDYGA